MTAAATARVPLDTKLYYGLGAAAYGIKDSGFSTFLLLFYNQVVGLPAAHVGAVIAAALVFDAMIDPFLGLMSDRTRSRWGRRHPWLYASAIPIAASWYLLWHPQGLSEPAKLGWLFATAVFARAAIATNEVPSLALAPELTRDYHERTIVLRYRYLFGWLGGLGFLTMAYAWFLRPPRGALTGPLGFAGYGDFGTTGAIVMAVTVLISALGTHRYAVRHAPPPVPRLSARETVAAIRETLGNRAFLVVMLAGLAAYTAQGFSFALSNYLLAFVWELTTAQLTVYSALLLGGVVLSFVFVTPISRLLGKVRASALLTAVAALCVTTPYALRLAGVMPATGTTALFVTLWPFWIAGTALGVAPFIMGASMMSDVVEASEETTGRREEGLFFAGSLFMQKCSGGIGILITGLVIQVAGFPATARPGTVDGAVLDRLSLLYVVGYLTLMLVAATVFLRFPFGERDHDARLARLAAQ